jgi:triacylglycerol esterase/lipase EstA (alpha/beta hydrolase family)
MLARLQQFITLTLIVTALVWAGAFVARGQTAWAFGGLLIILLGYAFVLAAEFVLVARVHGADPAPRATPGQLVRAWAGEVITAPRVFCWRQPFRSHAEPDVMPADAAGRRGVLLVHGFVCNRGLWNPWLRELRAAQVPAIAVNLEPVFGSIDAYIPILEAAVRRLELATGLEPVIVAHSMGGLATRAWLASAGNDARVHRVITLGTPHHGTWMARYAATLNSRQMQQLGPWLTQLAAREPAARYARFTCFYGHCDNIVFPPSTATLPGADNRHLEAVAHVHMTYQPSVFSEVRRWLSMPAAVASGTREAVQ